MGGGTDQTEISFKEIDQMLKKATKMLRETNKELIFFTDRREHYSIWQKSAY